MKTFALAALVAAGLAVGLSPLAGAAVGNPKFCGSHEDSGAEHTPGSMYKTACAGSDGGGWNGVTADPATWGSTLMNPMP